MGNRVLILIGGGGHSAVVCDAANASGWSVVGFLDDDPNAALDPGSGPIRHAGPILVGAGASDTPWICALGDLPTRARILGSLGDSASATVLHPRAIVSDGASIGAGVFVGPGAIVNTRAAIGDHAILNSGCIVEHDASIGRNTHIAPGAVLGGSVAIGAGTLVGANATVLPGRSIGAGVRVGAGAVVTRDVPDGATVVGAPARVIDSQGR